MHQDIKTRVRVTLRTCARVGAMGFVCLALYILVDVIFGHGGSTGNILRMGLAALLFVTGLVLFAISAFVLESTRQES